ncbi:hypothetical protein BGZ68_002996 [Mortierella alpina]|nr:hypothetical protein BGZ68_002996 [Mortierella alpina]
MAADVFSIPELAAMVAQYLPPRDIAACRLTSRAFNNTLHPYFWKHISVSKPDNMNRLERIFHRTTASAPLYRNCQYIETLSLEIFAAQYLQTLRNTTSADDGASAPLAPVQEPAGTPPHPAFLSLKFLSITVGAIKNHPQLGEEDSVIPHDSLKTLLETASNITSLILYPEVLESANFMSTLKSGLPHLRTLILTTAPKLFKKTFPTGPPKSFPLDPEKSFSVSSVLSALPLLLAKPKLTTLELGFSLLYDEEVPPALVSKTIKALAENPRAKSAITSMVFPHTSNPFSLAFVKPVLEFCLPQLQILNVPSIGALDLTQLIAVVPDHCPYVRELNLVHLGRSDRGSQAMAEQVVRLIKICKDLRAYHGPSYKDSETCRAITQALLQHASTLESLVFTEEMNSYAFADLISSMPALRTLIVFWTFYVDVEGAISVRWAPRHLQRLEMTIRVEDTIASYVKSQKLDLDPELNPGLPSEGLDDEALSYVAMRKLFKNIGELTELEELYVNHYYYKRWKSDMDWTLQVGLGFLGGLMKLRKLRLDYGVQHMGQAEIEFIYEHWLSLEEVYFYMNIKHLNRCKRTWGWLKSRRPDLKYTYQLSVKGHANLFMTSEPYEPIDQALHSNIDGY